MCHSYLNSTIINIITISNFGTRNKFMLCLWSRSIFWFKSINNKTKKRSIFLSNVHIWSCLSYETKTSDWYLINPRRFWWIDSKNFSQGFLIICLLWDLFKFAEDQFYQLTNYLPVTSDAFFSYFQFEKKLNLINVISNTRLLLARRYFTLLFAHHLCKSRIFKYKKLLKSLFSIFSTHTSYYFMNRACQLDKGLNLDCDFLRLCLAF